MNDGGRRIARLDSYEARFNRSTNSTIPDNIFTDGETIPVFVDSRGYAFHRDTLQLLGFFTSRTAKNKNRYTSVFKTTST